MADSGSSKERQKYKRLKHPCPVCKKVVTHLPRHLRGRHGWSHSKSVDAISVFGLRAQSEKKQCPIEGCSKSFTNISEHLRLTHKINKEEIESLLSQPVPVAAKPKRPYKRRVCPVEGCRAVVYRIHQHLGKGKHKLSRDDPKYWRYLKTIKFVELDPNDESIIEISSSDANDSEKSTSCSEESVFQVFSTKRKIQTESDSENESSSSSITSQKEEELLKKIRKVNRHRKSTAHQLPFDEIDFEDDFEEEEEEDDDEEEEEEEEDDDEEEEYERAGTTAAAAGNSRTEAILNNFEKWLTSIDGGRKDVRVAKGYAGYIFKIVCRLSPTYQEIFYLFDKIRLRNKWLKYMEEKRQPGTIMAYLIALALFMRYIDIEKPSGLEMYQEQTSVIINQVRQWKKSLRGPLNNRRWQKQKEDLEKLITPADVQRFDKSKATQEAISILSAHIKNNPSQLPSKTNYCLVRDHLLTRITIDNACRTGPLANMTLGDLEKAKASNDQMVVTILKHKTLTACGPTNLVLGPKVYNWLQNFVRFMRNNIPEVGKDPDDYVFLTITGKKMLSSMITTQLGSFWQRALNERNIRVNAASFRKAAVSQVHDRNDNALEDNLAILMGHNKTTATRFYRLRKNQGKAAETSLKLKQIMYGKETESTSSTSQNNNNNNNEASASRHSWTENELSSLKSEFETAIQNRHIDMETVEETVRDHVILGHVNVRDVFQKVNDLIKENNTREKTLMSSPQIEKEQGTSAPQNENRLISKLSRKGGKTFTGYQTQIFWRLFKPLITSNQNLSKKDIQKKIEEDPEAKREIVGFTPLQLITKIRTERSKYNRDKNKSPNVTKATEKLLLDNN